MTVLVNTVRSQLIQMQGLIEKEEGDRLAELASQVPEWASIVEVGSHTGLSTCWLAMGSRAGRGAHITCIDPWPTPRDDRDDDDPFGLGAEGVLQRFKDNVTAMEAWDLVTPLRASSLDIAVSWVAPIGLIFIDALHEYEHVAADYAAWLPHVMQGGRMAFHDYWMDPERTVLRTGAVMQEVVEPSGLWVDTEVCWNTWIGRRV